MKAYSFAVLIICVLAGCGSETAPAGDNKDAAESVVADWVQALNSRNFARACELSVASEESACERLLGAAFKGYEGKVAVEGAYADGSKSGQEPLVFSLAEGPDGFSAGKLEKVDGDLRVHWEAQIIR